MREAIAERQQERAAEQERAPSRRARAGRPRRHRARRSRSSPAPARADRIAELKVQWDALPPMPSEYAASLNRRFQDACRAFEDRERRRMLAQAAAGRLETLATELEQLVGLRPAARGDRRALARPAPRRRRAARARRRQPGGGRAARARRGRARGEGAAAPAGARQAGAGQPAAAAAAVPAGRDAGGGEQITLKAGDRALRDIRAALEERVPLPSKKDRQEIQARLEAARARARPARAGTARRRRVAALGQPAGAGRAVQARWRRSRPRRTSRPPSRRMRELQGRWKQVALAPRAQGEAMWRRFKTAQDEVFARTAAHFAAQNAERAANLREKQALVRARRGAGRLDRLGEDRRRDPGAAGRVEDDRPGQPRPREGGLGAVPRRLRSVLHAPAGRPEEAQGRVVGEPRAQGSALRAGRGAGRVDRLGRRRGAAQAAAGRVEDDRAGAQVEVRGGLAALPRRRAIASSIATSIATRSSCRGRPRRAKR